MLKFGTGCVHFAEGFDGAVMRLVDASPDTNCHRYVYPGAPPLPLHTSSGSTLGGLDPLLIQFQVIEVTDALSAASVVACACVDCADAFGVGALS